MNTFFVRHLILKEVRYQRARLLLIWLMVYLLPLTNFFQNEHFNELAATFKSGMIILLGLLIVLTWVSSILLDPTYGSDRFLTTRPLKWKLLLVSEILFVGLLLWIRVIIFRLAILWATHVQLSYQDQAFYIFESTLFFLAAAAPFVLTALFFRRLIAVILFIGGSVIVGYIFGILWSVGCDTFNLNSVCLPPTVAGAPDGDPHLAVSLRISSFLVVCAILAVTMVPVAMLRYWKPALPVPLTVVFAGLFLCLAYDTYWPYALTQIASDQTPSPRELAS